MNSPVVEKEKRPACCKFGTVLYICIINAPRQMNADTKEVTKAAKGRAIPQAA